MSLPKETYEGWYHNLLLRLLKNLSDQEYQRKIWIDGESFYEGRGSLADSFGEAACSFFDDANLREIGEMRDDGFLSEKEYQILLPLHQHYRSFLDNHRELYEKFTVEDLNSQEWTDITELAAKTLEKLRENKRK